MTTGLTGFWFEDPRPIALKAPYTFFLPSEDETAAIEPGDLVKVCFQYGEGTEKWDAERMWLTVLSVDGDQVTGRLDNEPDEPNSPVAYGQIFTVPRHFALAVLWADGKVGPPEPQYREFWDRCLVDDCVTDGTEPVEYLYRETPDMGVDDDRYPDSGWRIRGRQGAVSDQEMDDRTASYVAIGLVLNKDDSWIHLIDRPAGCAFMRNFETGNYEAVAQR